MKKGSIKLVAQKKNGEEILKDVLERGEIFGKCFGGENEDLSEEAIALDDSMICFLSYETGRNFSMKI